MKDEINKIIQSISDFYKLDNALKYYLDRHKAQILLDYITNLQERIDKAIIYIERCRDYHRDIHKEERIFPDEITSLLMMLNGGDEE